jgi:hypothetical protein
MQVQSPSVARDLGRVARDWEGAYQRAPERVTGAVGGAVKASGKYFFPAGEVAAGGWLFTRQGSQALATLRGRDGTYWKASTSGTDRALGTTCHALMSLVGAGMAVHGALKLAQSLASDLEKH